MEKMTKEMVLALVNECEMEKEKTKLVPHYYKRNGKMIERNYPERVYTERFKELFDDVEEKTLRSESAKIFRCTDCGELVGYWDLETWNCDFDEDEYICSCCYEEKMGDDL